MFERDELDDVRVVWLLARVEKTVETDDRLVDDDDDEVDDCQLAHQRIIQIELLETIEAVGIDEMVEHSVVYGKHLAWLREFDDDDEVDDTEQETDEIDEQQESRVAIELTNIDEQNDEIDEMVEYGENDEIDEIDWRIKWPPIETNVDICIDDSVEIDEIDSIDETDDVDAPISELLKPSGHGFKPWSLYSLNVYLPPAHQ